MYSTQPNHSVSIAACLILVTHSGGSGGSGGSGIQWYAVVYSGVRQCAAVYSGVQQCAVVCTSNPTGAERYQVGSWLSRLHLVENSCVSVIKVPPAPPRASPPTESGLTIPNRLQQLLSTSLSVCQSVSPQGRQ